MNRLPPPQKLSEDLGDYHLTETDAETGFRIATYALERLQGGEAGFTIELLPLSSRVNSALVASFYEQDDVYIYSNNSNLREIIENKTRNMSGMKYLISMDSRLHYYCFLTDWFSYNQLELINSKILSIDFIMINEESDALFCFFDDSPASYMSFKTEEMFSKDFISSKNANKIFRENMLDWKMTRYPQEEKWLKTIEEYFKKTMSM